MTSHNVHPGIREHGLSDDCFRCTEHARYPFEGLDSGNMEDLVDRIKDKQPPRSVNEAAAMAKITAAIIKAEMLWQYGWRPQ